MRFVYIDDVIVYSKNPQEHAKHLELVLQRLKEAGLKSKPYKCQIGCSEVPLLGYITSASGIRGKHEKTKTISSMDPPTNVSEVGTFLGMTGYYRQLVLTMQKLLLH